MKNENIEIFRASDILRDAMPPQAPATIWKHSNLPIAMHTAGFYLVSSDCPSKSLELSLEIASKVASTKTEITPSLGVNPFTGIDESAEYDAMLREEARNMNVLYLNSLATRTQLERALIGVLPQMESWIWTDRRKGGNFPYGDLALHLMHIGSGTIMKAEEKTRLTEFVRHNNIRLLVLNSFEFASRTQREKDDLVHMLKQLRDDYGLSVLVFTQETEKRLKTGSRRGPIGSLAMLASFITTIETLAPELYEGVSVLEEKTQKEIDAAPGYEGVNITEKSEHVNAMLENATWRDLKRRYVTFDGKVVNQSFDHRLNSGSASVKK